MRIDFIAGHQLLTQGAQAVYEALQERAECAWRIGRPIKPTGAEAAVFIDHMHHHPDFAGWKKRFYLLHDLGDIDVYVKEREALQQFTAVIVPDELHLRAAQQALSRRWWRKGTRVLLGGWPKYDGPKLAEVNPSLAQAITELPQRPTVLYAPSWAGEDEWKELLPALAAAGVNVTIKNHPYATAPREEVSEYYRYCRETMAAMEDFGRRHDFIVAPADLNVCLLFPYVTAAVSDQSSVLAEFLPWGKSFETGANPEGSAEPNISPLYPAVIFRPLPALLKGLTGDRSFLKEITNWQQTSKPELGAGQKIANMIWETICST